MKSAQEIFDEAQTLDNPNAGIFALANWVDDDNSRCIYKLFADDNRPNCYDACICCRPNYMLCCVQTMIPEWVNEPAIKVYNSAMQS